MTFFTRFCIAFGLSCLAAPVGMSACIDSVVEQVRGKITGKRASQLQELLDAGPERWIRVSNESLRGKIFQRGLSGAVETGSGISSAGGGVGQFLYLMAGESNTRRMHTSVLKKNADSDFYLDAVNRAYTMPAAVKGKAKRKFAFDDTTLPNNSSAETIPADTLTIDDVHSIGFFFTSQTNRIYTWCHHYLTLHEALNKLGFEPELDSRGHRFLQQLKEIWQEREWHYPYEPQFGFNELRNKETITTMIHALLYRYES